MIQQRRVPVRAWQSCGVWAVVLCLLPAAGCLFALGSIRDASSSLAAAGIVLAVVAVAIIVFMLLMMKRVQVDASARAKIVRRSKEAIDIEGGGPNFIDLLLNVAAWSYLQARPGYEHTVVLVFEVNGPVGERHKVTLAAKVSRELYERYTPGTFVGVDYAMANPSYAVIEGEQSYQGPEEFDTEAATGAPEMAAIELAAEPVGNERRESATDYGALAGIICGLLGAWLGVVWSAGTMIGFTENAPAVCTVVAAVYALPMGIGGAKLGARMGQSGDGAANRLGPYAGAILGGALAFGVTALLMKFIEMLGQ